MTHVATGIEAIEKTLHKTNEWLNEIETELGLEDRHIAFQTLRAVLHVLRDRLPAQEAANLGSQLPILIRGVYYENFNPGLLPIKDRKSEDFLARVQTQIFGWDVVDPERIVRAVFKVVKKHVSDGEIKDVIANFPKPLARLWQ